MHVTVVFTCKAAALRPSIFISLSSSHSILPLYYLPFCVLYSVKPAVFDLFLAAAIAGYLGIIYLFVQVRTFLY